MSTLTVIDLLKELKDGQEKICERLTKLEANNVTQEELSALVVQNDKVGEEVSSLVAQHHAVKYDLACKFEALKLAVRYQAGTRVAHVPELLEMVLVHDRAMKELLLAQRVSSQFKNTIDNSKQIQ